MSNYKFLHPIEVRYGDLDPQGHVNNAKHLTYFEQARVHYLIRLGLFSRDQSFMEIGVVIADIHIAYKSPIHYEDNVQVGVKTTRIGNKSMVLEQCVMNSDTGEIMSAGTVVMVAYDYKDLKPISVPDDWKKKISEFEKLNIER
jgi:acyl-CoA thioester hydrolase